MKFSDWLKLREMLSPVTLPSITNASPEVGAKLKVLTAFNTGEPKLSRLRKKMLKKGSEDGDWR